jgi:hypothetical protein
MQRKTQRPVQFELTEPTRAAVVSLAGEGAICEAEQFLFPSQPGEVAPRFDAPVCARIVHQWAESAIGLDSIGLRDAHHAADQGNA